MSNKIKSGDKLSITGKKWFDSVNGNTYFRCHIQLNGETLAKLPFQYGYDNHYVTEANNWLAENGYIDSPKKDYGGREELWRYCSSHEIEFEHSSYAVKTQKLCKNDTF